MMLTTLEAKPPDQSGFKIFTLTTVAMRREPQNMIFHRLMISV